MANTHNLLSLPFELRDLIWTFCSSTGDANGLLRCCHQTNNEFTPHCVLPKDIKLLQKVRIWVDSTYDHGIWLKFDYSWEEKGYMHRAINAVRDMDDPVAQRLLAFRQVKETEVCLHAPRRGYFVGALFMMLAKANDAYRLIQRMTLSLDMVQAVARDELDMEKYDLGYLTLTFSTENRQPGQTENEAKNFWECRSPKVLQEAIRKHLFKAGEMPHFYEYFLINDRLFFLRPPTINYLTWPRKHVHRKETMNREEVRQELHEICFQDGDKERLLAFIKSRRSGRKDFQRKIAEYSAKMMTVPGRFSRNQIRIGAPEIPENHWEHINYDKANLMSRFQFWLDNLPGPVGGCMDMLRLHRFKTLDASSANFFACNAGKERAGLVYAAFEISVRLRALFDPFAREEVLRLRESCPHLRAVSWSTDSTMSPCEACPAGKWLEYYPNGIRYYWNGQNIIQWLLSWSTNKLHPEMWHSEEMRGMVNLDRSWGCFGCCQNLENCMNHLTIHSGNSPAQIWDTNTKSNRRIKTALPLLLRRVGSRAIHRIVRNGYVLFKPSEYHCLAKECWEWETSPEEGSSHQYFF